MIEYITKHWADIVGIVGGVVIVARIVVKLTPTPKDDTVLEKVVNVLKHIGLNVKLIPLAASCLLLTSCGSLPDGTKTFFGVTGKQGWQIAKGAIIREAPIVYGELQTVKSSNAATSAKQPTDVQP